MTNRYRVIAALLLAYVALPALADDAAPSAGTADGQTWLDMLAAAGDKAPAADKAASQPAGEKKGERKGTPLPFHCIEGYSGGAITPMGYICNRCECGACGGKDLTPPSVSYSFMGISTKQLHTFAVTQGFLDRFEFGYAVNHLLLGSLVDDVRKAGADPVREDVYLHNFNLRAKVLAENSFDLPLPAVAAGVHFKYNHGIGVIDERLGGALSSIGMDKNNGVDYTLTATKMFPRLAFGRPLILTGGLRLSEAAQLGLMGFGHTYRASFEGSAVVLPTDWLVLGYEFRQKHNPYDKIAGLIGDEDNWQALSVSWIVNKHLTISALSGIIGNVANANADSTWGIQVKYEF
jgi:hypothetical protein